MKKEYYAVIMAGGVGSRFWPMSTQEFPKQFHDMLGVGQSLIQRTFDRINGLVLSENILIATNKRYENLVLEQIPKCNKKQLILEPAMRNTAPCILYAALKIYNQNKDAVMLIAPSDHWIDDEEEFIKNIQTSFDACAEQDILMTLGIQPDSPNTGYGYIKFEENKSDIKKVKNFTEKPDLKTAKQFLKSGKYLWNAGIFVWSAKSIITAFEKSLPEMVALFKTGKNVWNTDLESDFIKENYEKTENISIDFGIMEHANNVHVLPVDFGWNDLGTWGSLYDKLEKDEHKNAVVGAKTIFRDANGNMIKTQNGKKIVIQGLSDFIIVEKEDVILICPRKDEQDIKQIANEVKENFGDEIYRRFKFPLASTTGKGNKVTLKFKKTTKVNHIIIQEDIRLGEHIRKYQIEGLVGRKWKVLAYGESVGNKRIERIEDVEISRLRLKVLASDKQAQIKNLSVYFVADK